MPCILFLLRSFIWQRLPGVICHRIGQYIHHSSISCHGLNEDIVVSSLDHILLLLSACRCIFKICHICHSVSVLRSKCVCMIRRYGAASRRSTEGIWVAPLWVRLRSDLSYLSYRINVLVSASMAAVSSITCLDDLGKLRQFVRSLQRIESSIVSQLFVHHG